jgi:ACS family sodium-dependent inorganic phosphate cotransporter
VGVVTAASYAGTALAFGLSPLLITKFGWPAVFYLFGGAALVWLPFWLPLNVYSHLHGSNSSGKQTPDSAAAAAEEQQPLVTAAGGGSGSSTTMAAAAGSSGSSTTGFRALMRRREVWAICACQYSQSYGMYGLLTWLPTFFSEFYEVQVGDLGGYTLLPYFVQVRRRRIKKVNE